MKLKILLFSFFLGSVAFAQTPIGSGNSETKHIKYQPVKEVKRFKSIPDLRITNYKFVDENKNNIIDADENNNISFEVINNGKGLAEGVYVKVSLNNSSIAFLILTSTSKIKLFSSLSPLSIETPIAP